MPKSRSRRAAAEEVTEGLQAILDSAQEFLETLGDQKGAAVDDLRARLSATVASTTRRLSSFAGEASVQAAKSTVRYVRREPWKAVGIAVLALAAWQLATHLMGDDEEDGDD